MYFMDDAAVNVFSHLLRFLLFFEELR